MERYAAIGKEHLRFNLWQHILIGVGLLALSPFILGIRNLDAVESAKVLEIYVALIGIIVLVPLFLPEQNQDIRDLIRSKFTDIRAVYAVRYVLALAAAALLLFGYVLLMKSSACDFDTVPYYFGVLAEMIAFGGLGIFCFSLSGNVVVGYMLPIMYYIAAWGAGRKYMGLFYPFSIMTGSFREKWVLLAAGIILTILGIWNRGRKTDIH